MKKSVALILAIIFVVSVCGCTTNAQIIEDGKIKGVTVTSIPEGYYYSFCNEEAKAVADYLKNLSLKSIFTEDPNAYTGMTWDIELEYENGETVTVYHFGNMFIRTEDGPWYKMTYKQASRLASLLYELDN